MESVNWMELASYLTPLLIHRRGADTKGLKPISKMKRLPRWKTLHSYFKFIVNPTKSHEQQLELHKYFGDIESFTIPCPCVLLFDPELVEKALRNQGPRPTRLLPSPCLPDYYASRGIVKGLIIAEDEQWYKYRSLVSKKIMSPQHIQSFEPAIVEVMDAMIKKLEQKSLEFSLQDPQGRKFIQHFPNEMYKWALETIGTVLFETRLGCLQTPMPSNVQSLINSLNEITSGDVFWYPNIVTYNFQKKLGSPYVKRYFAAMDNVYDFVSQVVSRQKKELMEAAEKKEVTVKQGAVLTYLLLDETMSDEEVLSNIKDLLLAGTDNISNTLVWTLYELSRNPDSLLKLEKEIDMILGDLQDAVPQKLHKGKSEEVSTGDSETKSTV